MGAPQSPVPAAPGGQQPLVPPPWEGTGLKGKLEYYVSKMDGATRPYAVCATSDSPEPKPLVIVVSPGAPTDAGPNEIRKAEDYAWYAKKNNKECIVLRATGRGPGSVYQNYGEVDVLEAIDDIVTKYPIDRDRISVIGFSMGGAATWYLISHYPDLFSAGAPGAGYCDYRLWEKPGGFTFPMQPWEEPSWQARSGAFLIGNFEHTPMWIFHGAWDRSSGAGVAVAQSQNMFVALTKMGFNVHYTEVPKTGHFGPPEVQEQAILWLIQQKKERHPKHVSLTTYELRHNKSYWVSIDQIERCGLRASLDATQTATGLVVETDNLRGFTLGPIPGTKAQSVRVDGKVFSNLDLSTSCAFYRTAKGGWKSGAADLSGQKHHGCSGPITDIFFDNLILVPGTTGTEEETHFNTSMASNTATLFTSENGGLHRGGIRGANTITLTSIKDLDLKEGQIRDNNLLLVGTDKTNAVLRKYRDRLPITFKAGTIRLGRRTYQCERVAVLAVFPHPDNPQRYFAVFGGVTPDAITWGSHLNLQLLPDYVVFDRGKMLEWGFWDNAWKHPVGWPVRR
jgi:hypothetical protein